jgi:fatty-acid desaturase
LAKDRSLTAFDPAVQTLLVACWTSFGWAQMLGAVAAGLLLCQLNLYLTTAVLHRGITHGAIVYPRWLQRLVVIWLFFTAHVQPLTWTGAHRQHHATSDTPDDPHAPGRIGFWRVMLLTWYYVPRWARANWAVATQRYLYTMQKERLLYQLDRPSTGDVNFYGQLALSLALGPVAIAFWLSRIVPYALLSGYVNSAGHTLGERPFDNLATDARGWLQTMLGYVVGGETLGHNYHHRYPARAVFRSEGFDPGFWFATVVLRGTPVRSPAPRSLTVGANRVDARGTCDMPS